MNKKKKNKINQKNKNQNDISNNDDNSNNDNYENNESIKPQNSNNMENKNDVKNENIRKDEIIVEKVLINRISTDLLVQCILYTSLCSFMLGYHVHEKAILIPIICSALLTSKSNENAILFLRLSAIGIFSLFPLFTEIDELLIKCEQIFCFLLLFCICNINFDCFLSPNSCYIKIIKFQLFIIILIIIIIVIIISIFYILFFLLLLFIYIFCYSFQFV